MFEQILEYIEKYDTVIIHRHKNPDGDAIGSQIGLKHLILANYEGKRVYAVGDAPGRYSFMEDSTPDEISDGTYEGALAIIVDTSASALISDGRYTTADRVVRIDHHLFCEKIADCEVVDTSYESCCGLIVSLSQEAGWKMTESAAKLLYTGTVTDSGRFRYDSTTPDTLRRSAYLLESKVDTGDIYRNLYADDFSNLLTRAQFLLKVKFTEHNVAYIYTTKEEVKELGLDTFTISRGMVGVMSEIRGVNIWVNFTETEEGVLCELRSSLYNINKTAVKYGGGGHEKASGATVADRAAAMEMLKELDKLAEEKR